jgi:hypothetical protein
MVWLQGNGVIAGQWTRVIQCNDDSSVVVDGSAFTVTSTCYGFGPWGGGMFGCVVEALSIAVTPVYCLLEG